MNLPLIERVVMGVIIVVLAVLAVLILLGIAGCTLLAPENETRVTEYQGNGSYMMQAQGVAAGCRVVRAGTVPGCLRFSGTTCSYTSEGCEEGELTNLQDGGAAFDP